MEHETAVYSERFSRWVKRDIDRRHERSQGDGKVMMRKEERKQVEGKRAEFI